MKYTVLDKLINDKNITQKEMAAAIGMSRVGYLNMIKSRSMKVETLEKIAKYFDVNINQFFEDEKETENHVSTKEKDDLNLVIDSLNETINAKNEVIKAKGETVSVLKGHLDAIKNISRLVDREDHKNRHRRTSRSGFDKTDKL